MKTNTERKACRQRQDAYVEARFEYTLANPTRAELHQMLREAALNTQREQIEQGVGS